MAKTTIKKSKHSTGTIHPYQKGYAFWVNNPFWENSSMTEKGKQYFRDSLERMGKGYNFDESRSGFMKPFQKINSEGRMYIDLMHPFWKAFIMDRIEHRHSFKIKHGTHGKWKCTGCEQVINAS